MTAVNNFYVFKDAQSAQESGYTGNVVSDSLYVEVDGDFTSLEIEVKGVVDHDQENYVNIGGTNISTFDFVSTIKSKGIFLFPIEGLGRFKFNLKTITGTVTVFCRMIKG